jgi:hypothetical protein
MHNRAICETAQKIGCLEAVKFALTRAVRLIAQVRGRVVHMKQHEFTFMPPTRGKIALQTARLK